MIFGSGKYTYQVVQDWARLPEGWEWLTIPAVACDSQDRVFVGSRADHPLIVFDRDGNFLESWGDEFLECAWAFHRRRGQHLLHGAQEPLCLQIQSSWRIDHDPGDTRQTGGKGW